MRQERHKRHAVALVLAALLLAGAAVRANVLAGLFPARSVIAGVTVRVTPTGVVADVVASHVTVATTATLLATADGDGEGVMVRNAGSTSIFLGGSGVTTAAGFELVVGAAQGLGLGPGEALYGIVASGTETAHVIRTGAP